MDMKKEISNQIMEMVKKEVYLKHKENILHFESELTFKTYDWLVDETIECLIDYMAYILSNDDILSDEEHIKKFINNLDQKLNMSI